MCIVFTSNMPCVGFRTVMHPRFICWFSLYYLLVYLSSLLISFFLLFLFLFTSFFIFFFENRLTVSQSLSVTKLSLFTHCFSLLWVIVYLCSWCEMNNNTHLTALCPGLPRWIGTKNWKVKPVWIFGSKRQWVAVASARPYTSLHLATDRQPCHQHPTTQFLARDVTYTYRAYFTGHMPFLLPNQLLPKHWRQSLMHELLYCFLKFNLGYFTLYLLWLFLLVLISFSGWKEQSKTTYFVSSGMWNLICTLQDV